MEDDRELKAIALRTEPPSIDFGNLSPGGGLSVSLDVYGGPGNASVYSDQLKVSPIQWEEEQIRLEITLLGGSSGELIWDELILRSNNQELKVPITARWNDPIVETTISEAVLQDASQPQIRKKSVKEERTYKGRVCSLCGRNFGYDVDSGTWEQCTCSWYQMVNNMSLRIIRELRYGAKDIPSYLEELWRVLLGKEKW